MSAEEIAINATALRPSICIRKVLTNLRPTHAFDRCTRFAPDPDPNQLTLVHADVTGLSPDQHEVIGEKVTYRIAQRPAAYALAFTLPA